MTRTATILLILILILATPVHIAFACGGGGGGGAGGGGGGGNAFGPTVDPTQMPGGVKGLTAEQNRAVENFLNQWLRGQLTNSPAPAPAWQTNPATVFQASRPSISTAVWNTLTPQQQANVLNGAYNATRAVQRGANLGVSHLAGATGPPGKVIAVGYGGLTGMAGAVAEGETNPSTIIKAGAKGATISLITLPRHPVTGELIGEGLSSGSLSSLSTNATQPPSWAAPPPVTYHGQTLHH